jgi:hypothetical protein
MPNESHTTHVDSRRQSDNPGHLDRASAKTRPAVNETRSLLVGGPRQIGRVVTIDEVRALASTLPRAYEVLVHDQVKFRVGRIVFLAFSRDETIMGVGFPKEERAALVAAEPDKFLLPRQSDLRYHWVHARLAALDQAEMEELVLDAWRMCVPRKVAAAHLGPEAARPAPRPSR